MPRLQAATSTDGCRAVDHFKWTAACCLAQVRLSTHHNRNSARLSEMEARSSAMTYPLAWALVSRRSVFCSSSGGWLRPLSGSGSPSSLFPRTGADPGREAHSSALKQCGLSSTFWLAPLKISSKGVPLSGASSASKGKQKRIKVASGLCNAVASGVPLPQARFDEAGPRHYPLPIPTPAGVPSKVRVKSRQFGRVQLRAQIYKERTPVVLHRFGGGALDPSASPEGPWLLRDRRFVKWLGRPLQSHGEPRRLIGTIATASRMDGGGAFRSQVVHVASGVLAAPEWITVHQGPDRLAHRGALMQPGSENPPPRNDPSS